LDVSHDRHKRYPLECISGSAPAAHSTPAPSTIHTFFTNSKPAKIDTVEEYVATTPPASPQESQAMPMSETSGFETPPGQSPFMDRGSFYHQFPRPLTFSQRTPTRAFSSWGPLAHHRGANAICDRAWPLTSHPPPHPHYIPPHPHFRSVLGSWRFQSLSVGNIWCHMVPFGINPISVFGSHGSPTGTSKACACQAYCFVLRCRASMIGPGFHIVCWGRS